MGGVNHHVLRIVKRAAKRAGLTDIRVDDHKFRSTAITRWLREGNSVPDVMAWVGHNSPTTILRYAAKVKLEKPETQQKAHSPFVISRMSAAEFQSQRSRKGLAPKAISRSVSASELAT